MDIIGGSVIAGTRLKKRSPLKDRPLRTPGQSLDERIVDVVSDDMMGLATLAIALTMLGCLEWTKAIYSISPAPWLYTGFALFAFLYAAIESTMAPVISRPGNGSSVQNGSLCRREKGKAMLLVRVTGTMLRQ